MGEAMGASGVRFVIRSYGIGGASGVRFVERSYGIGELVVLGLW
jgi:hypothetical protein